MNKPTNEQKKEFWEKIGFKWGKVDYVSGLSSELNGTYETWVSPLASNGDKSKPLDNQEVMEGLPDIDLNNLFKYAVPKLPFLRMDYQPITEEFFFETMKPNDPNLKVGNGKDPALALFWAIWEVIK